MNSKILFSVFASAFLLIISLQFISAEIIWSLPTGVPFIVSEINNTINNTLHISIISPIEKTYTTKYIALIVKTNKPAICYYSVDDNQSVIFKDSKDTTFSKKLVLNNGNHQINIKCKADSEIKTAKINFKVSSQKKQNNTALEGDLAYEQELNAPKYSDWTCINNQLQRTVTIKGLDNTEYGNICGVTQINLLYPTKKSSILWLLPIVLLFLILIVLIAMIIVLMRKQLL